MPLTDLAIGNAKSEGRLTKLSDGAGLQLWVSSDGAKRWRLAYRFGGAQKLLAIGVYPTIGLKEARDARDAARKLLANGVDPMEAKKQARIEKEQEGANTFRVVAKGLLDKKRDEEKAAATLSKTQWLLDFAIHCRGRVARPQKG